VGWGEARSLPQTSPKQMGSIEFSTHEPLGCCRTVLGGRRLKNTRQATGKHKGKNVIRLTTKIFKGKLRDTQQNGAREGCQTKKGPRAGEAGPDKNTRKLKKTASKICKGRNSLEGRNHAAEQGIKSHLHHRKKPRDQSMAQKHMNRTSQKK